MTTSSGIGGSGLGGATVSRGASGSPPVIPHITNVALSAATIQDDASIGDVVGAITVTMSSGSFSGTLSLPTNPGGYFGISGANLVVAAALPAGPVTDPIVIRAFQNGNHKDKAQNISITAAPTYTGPLDLVPGAVVAYSQRALAAAWVSNAITIREDAGDTTQSFATTTSNAVDVAAVTAFLNGANGLVTALIDQSGNGRNLVQATTANQPAWVASQVGGKPGFAGADTVDNLALSGSFDFTGSGATIFVVAKSSFFSLSAFDPYVQIGTGLGTAASYVDMYDGTNEAGGLFPDTASDAFHIWEGAWEFGSTTYLCDGAALAKTTNFDSGGALASPITLTDILLGASTGSSPTAMQATEVIVWEGVKSSADRLAIRQNIATYYGITL